MPAGPPCHPRLLSLLSASPSSWGGGQLLLRVGACGAPAWGCLDGAWLWGPQRQGPEGAPKAGGLLVPCRSSASSSSRAPRCPAQPEPAPRRCWERPPRMFGPLLNYGPRATDAACPAPDGSQERPAVPWAQGTPGGLPPVPVQRERTLCRLPALQQRGQRPQPLPAQHSPEGSATAHGSGQRTKPSSSGARAQGRGWPGRWEARGAEQRPVC